MSNSVRSQRVRDPVHNLIEFGTDQLERTLWQVIQTRPFQRLRRIRQLGFSDLVFPGATHSRFSHSIGVFHTARQLIRVIERQTGELRQPHQEQVALAASLVHDVGHGMFSHSFEDVGKKLGLPMASHVSVSEALIRNGEIAEHLKAELGAGFAAEVADLLKREEPGNLYDSIVSSQFDADRLDYMQRDRLMTGVQSSGIDAVWLMANLEIGSIQASSDEQSSRIVKTLVLGPKDFHAAENYVLSLFQLYPNVYLHKTTRAAEKIFTCLLLRIFSLIGDGHRSKVGLDKNNPICLFADSPSDLEKAQALDDTVFWGALPMMAEARDPLVRSCAIQLRERRLPKCVDIRRYFDEQNPAKPGKVAKDRQDREASILIACNEVRNQIEEFARTRKPNQSQILLDNYRRSPYKKFQESKTPLNRILIRHGENTFEDMAHLSPVVQSAETFEICRAYHQRDDTEGRSMIWNILRTYAGRHNG